MRKAKINTGQVKACQDVKISADILFPAIEEQLSAGRKASFTVTGLSMWPFIGHARDQVIISACDPDTLKIGDIILFQPLTGKYILHRVTALREDAFETTGDGNCFRDGWFPRECVIARVETIIRDGKKIQCSKAGWRIAFYIWGELFPIRRSLLRLMRRLARYKARMWQ